MKKLFLTGITVCLLLFVAASCSTKSKAETAQSNKKEFLKMKGDWEIVSVDYRKGFKIKPFDEGADAQCFVGSHWRLIPNNNSGAYTLKGGGDCPSRTQPIKFDVVDGTTFEFKKIMDGEKAKNVTSGYSLTLISQATDQFSLQQSIPFDGEMVNVIYNFQRTAMQ